MTIMTPKQVKDAAAKGDEYMIQAYNETNAWDPRSIVWIVVALSVVVGIVWMIASFYDYVGLPDYETIRATAKALK